MRLTVYKNFNKMYFGIKENVMTICICVLVQHPIDNNLFLAVSRKDNPTDFGLPGGKYEHEDMYYHETGERETLEETGYEVYTLVGDMFENAEPMLDNYVFTYRGYLCRPNDIHEDIKPANPDETGVVKWLPASELIIGSFSEYNKAMFKHFGIPIE